MSHNPALVRCGLSLRGLESSTSCFAITPPAAILNHDLARMMSCGPRMASLKRISLGVLKVVLSVGIVAYLVYDAQRSHSDVFARLITQPKHWEFLFLAWAVCAMPS